jgi:hypothetical protein
MKTMRLAIAALGLVFMTALPAFAIDPLPVPVEGFGINSATNMEVFGSASHTQKYGHEVYSGDATIEIIGGDCCQPATLYQGTFSPLVAGGLAYEDTNKAVNGLFQLVKDFAAHGQADSSVDNIEASKLVGFTSDGSQASLYRAAERAGLEMFQNTGFSWAIAHPQEGDVAVCLGSVGSTRQLAMGSSLDVTNVQANTKTSFNMLGLRLGGSYGIDAEGTGTVTAGMIVDQRDNIWSVIYDGGCDVTGIPSLPEGFGGASITQYSQSSEASGTFSFGKDMSVYFDVEPSVPGVGGLLSLCPWSAPIPQLPF